MGLFLLGPLLQLFGIAVPLVGVFALFKKEHNKTSLSLFMTNIACFIINYSYLLLITTETMDGAVSCFKMIYLGNALFFFSYTLFLTNYFEMGKFRLRTILLTAWVLLEGLILFMLLIGDPWGLVFSEVNFIKEEVLSITFVMTVSGPLYVIRNLILCVVLAVGMVYTMYRMFRVKLKEERDNLGRLCGSQFIIIVALDITLIFRFPFDVTPLFSAVSILAIIIGVIHGDFFRVTDQGRNWVVENMENILVITDSQYGFLDANPMAVKAFPKLGKLEKNQRVPEEVISLFFDHNDCVNIGDKHYNKETEAIYQNNKVIGFSLLLNDNTEQHDLMEQVEAEKDRAEEANEAKSQFMSNMSHEIRIPMNAIVGMTDILLREELPPQTKEYLNNIKSSGDALLTIVNDILDFSKIEAGKMDIILDEYEPMSSLNDLSMIFLNRIGEKDVELLYDIDPALPQKLYGDRQRIRQVIINLMNNAIKFTERGFVKLAIQTEPIDETHINVIYRIEDSGQGIKEEDIGKLFRNFQQVDKEKNRYKEGTGLGLAISKQLVEMMGGTIEVTSEYGKGSIFSFNIPQEIRSENKAADVKAEKQEKTVVCGNFIQPLLREQFDRLVEIYGLKKARFEQVYAGEVQADVVFTDDVDMLTFDLCSKMSSCNTRLCVLHNPMQQNLSDKQATLINKPLYTLNFCQVINGERMLSEEELDILHFVAPEAKILIVDDHEMNLKVAKGLLEPLKIQIDTAENGKIAVDMVQKNQYHMVFMDHMMPVMDGVEALHRIRELPEEVYQKLPIIALSANATTEAQEYFSENGFSAFVPKPIKLKELCGCIRRMLPEELVVLQEVESQPLTASAYGSQTMELREETLVIEGINVKEGLENSGSRELFLSLLGDFYKLIDKKSSLVEQYLAEGMLREYTIEVHALKSTARMIGAMELSAMFYELEQLGNKEDQKTLEMKTPNVLSLYRSYKLKLEPFGKKDNQEKEAVSVEKMISALENLRDAMDNFDLDGADEAMKVIESYAFPEECGSKIEELSILVADVAMEEVIVIANQLINDLQS